MREVTSRTCRSLVVPPCPPRSPSPPRPPAGTLGLGAPSPPAGGVQHRPLPLLLCLHAPPQPTGGCRMRRRGRRGTRGEGGEGQGPSRRRPRGTTGTSDLILEKRRSTLQTPNKHPFHASPSPSPWPLSPVREKAHDSEATKTWVQITLDPSRSRCRSAGKPFPSPGTRGSGVHLGQLCVLTVAFGRLEESHGPTQRAWRRARHKTGDR